MKYIQVPVHLSITILLVRERELVCVYVCAFVFECVSEFVCVRVCV